MRSQSPIKCSLRPLGPTRRATAPSSCYNESQFWIIHQHYLYLRVLVDFSSKHLDHQREQPSPIDDKRARCAHTYQPTPSENSVIPPIRTRAAKPQRNKLHKQGIESGRLEARRGSARTLENTKGVVPGHLEMGGCNPESRSCSHPSQNLKQRRVTHKLVQESSDWQGA